jgi:ketosteroid isomerase-like protein
MKNLIYLALIAIAAISFTGCGPAPANNANTGNTNTNTASTAAPTAEALLELDKKANEAYFKGDSKFFETFLSDKFVHFADGMRAGKTEAVAEIAKVKCDVKRDWALTEPQMAKVDNDTYVLSYKGTFDGTCKSDKGEDEKIPSPVRAGTVFVRSGDTWQAANHNENLIVDPAAPPAPPANTASNSSNSNSANSSSNSNAAKSNSNTASSNSAASNSSSTANSNSNSNSNTAAAKPTPSANSDALVKIHTSGWEAWKAKDAKKLTDISTVNLAIINPIGAWISGQAAVVKAWTEMKCEGVTTVKVADGFASALSPTVEILTLKGTADGTCNGQKNDDIFQTAVYVKEGDAWKIGYMFEEAKK